MDNCCCIRLIHYWAAPSKELYLLGLRKRVIKKGYKMNMYYCCKIFATYLGNKGIEPEIIDLLQGRISSSVFVNHYYRPDINEIITKRIRPVLNELIEELARQRGPIHDSFEV